MSAIPVIEPISEPVIVRPRSTVAVPSLPGAVVVPRKRTRTRTISVANIGAYMVAFIIVAGFTSFFSSLAGNVMVEKARRDSILATEKARFAAREAATLREQVQAITSAKSIEDWANANGFVAAANLSQPSVH